LGAKQAPRGFSKETVSRGKTSGIKPVVFGGKRGPRSYSKNVGVLGVVVRASKTQRGLEVKRENHEGGGPKKGGRGQHR